MNLGLIRLRHFRNHTDTTIRFAPGTNVLLGQNGEGKTNIVEAVSYLSLTKSFYAANDATACQIGAENFDVEGIILSDAGIEHHMRVAYDRQQGEKVCTVNHARPESLSSVVGRFPIVILSPENSAITFGGPADRRRFMDMVLSQLSRLYLEDLLEYRRAIRQRNRILGEMRVTGSRQGPELEPWTLSIVRYGSRIIQRRLAFVHEFKRPLLDSYRKITGADEVPGVSLTTVDGLDPEANVEEIEIRMSEMIGEVCGEEFRRGLSLVGPHRDDLALTLNGNNLQRYASQGQHKTMLIALKMAEFVLMGEQRNEAPIFILDDVFSELDEQRSRNLISIIRECGQTIITSTEESRFHSAMQWNSQNKRFKVRNGICTEA